MPNFSHALERLKAGEQAYRSGWYGKHHLRLHRPVGAEPATQPYIVIVTQNGDVVPWLASQADLLADDWCVATLPEPASMPTSAEAPADTIAIKHVLAFLADPETYAIHPGDSLDVWMEDGQKIARLIEKQFLGEPNVLPTQRRVAYVRQAAMAADLTAFTFAAGPSGTLIAHWWNATDSEIVFVGDEIGPQMLDGEPVHQSFSFVVGFKPKTQTWILPGCEPLAWTSHPEDDPEYLPWSVTTTHIESQRVIEASGRTQAAAFEMLERSLVRLLAQVRDS